MVYLFVDMEKRMNNEYEMQEIQEGDEWDCIKCGKTFIIDIPIY